MKHPPATTRGLVGPVHYTDDGEPFQWRDPETPTLQLVVGQAVKVLTDEGALRRGRRRWHPGAIGTVLAKSKRHDLAWTVLVNGFTVLLFSDEMDYVAQEKEIAA